MLGDLPSVGPGSSVDTIGIGKGCVSLNEVDKGGKVIREETPAVVSMSAGVTSTINDADSKILVSTADQPPPELEVLSPRGPRGPLVASNTVGATGASKSPVVFATAVSTAGWGGGGISLEKESGGGAAIPVP
ncbi:unnamed protein product, partial [Choristocarpus tenellus]